MDAIADTLSTHAIADTLSTLTVAALVVWYLGAPLLRLTATSCLLCASALLALGDIDAAAGVAACGVVCSLSAKLLYCARRVHAVPRACGASCAARGRRAISPLAHPPDDGRLDGG